MAELIPSPSSSKISLGPVTLHYYALCIITGIVVAVWLGRKRYSSIGGNPDDVSEAAIWAVPFGIIGGRIYHVITSPQKYFGKNGNPTDAFLIGKGIGKTTENSLNLWQPAEEPDANFVFFYNYIRKGVESYYVGRVTIRVTRLESGAPNMTQLGAIDSYEWPAGFQPPGGEDANYLLSGVRSQQEGQFFRTTYEYMSSPAKAAWDFFLYGFTN
jgi:hypothetical protein